MYKTRQIREIQKVKKFESEKISIVGEYYTLFVIFTSIAIRCFVSFLFIDLFY